MRRSIITCDVCHREAADHGPTWRRVTVALLNDQSPRTLDVCDTCLAKPVAELAEVRT